MPDTVDCVVAGAGVVGMSIAKAIADSGKQVLVVETASTFGSETTSRNSGVIHAGFYYPPNSLKSVLCRRGNSLLYKYCEARGVAHKKIGKLIVATSDSDSQILYRYFETAKSLGIPMEWVSATEAMALEPSIRCRLALWSPTSGIVDVHELMLALIADLESRDGLVVYRTTVMSAHNDSQGVVLKIEDDSGKMELRCRHFINATGLFAQNLARRIRGIDVSTVPPLHLAKGRYYRLARRSPFQRLIYPVSSGPSLGIHVTLDMSGAAQFGPDIEWIDTVNYNFEDTGRKKFVDAISRYYPDVGESDLSPAYTGIRPKIVGPGALNADFSIAFPHQHRVPGVINLFGIESPGLTAALAIGDFIADKVSR